MPSGTPTAKISPAMAARTQITFMKRCKKRKRRTKTERQQRKSHHPNPTPAP